MALMPGETILITGGAGMVGQAAAAIARWRGAEPIIAGRRKPDGDGHFIDTSTTDLREAVLDLTGGRGADLVLDTVGGALFWPALRSLTFGGRMIGIFSAPEPQPDFSVAERRGAHQPGERGHLTGSVALRHCSGVLYRCALISAYPVGMNVQAKRVRKGVTGQYPEAA